MEIVSKLKYLVSIKEKTTKNIPLTQKEIIYINNLLPCENAKQQIKDNRRYHPCFSVRAGLFHAKDKIPVHKDRKQHQKDKDRLPPCVEKDAE